MVLRSLLRSRKFWIAVISSISGLVLYLQGAITAEVLADSLVLLATVLIGSIAVEDYAEKSSHTAPLHVENIAEKTVNE